MQGALSRGSAWFLFGLAFIVVYREVFETILFYAALWTADNGATILAGALTGASCCSRSIAWAMLRLSRTLPIGQFFRYSAILIAILAVILAGKGIGALQEAGLIGDHPAAGRAADSPCSACSRPPRRSARSCCTLAALVIGFRSAARPRKPAVAAE